MKIKSLTIIFVVFLSITLVSGLAVFLTKEKSQPVLSQQSGAVEKRLEPLPDKLEPATAIALKNKKIVEAVRNSPPNADKPKEIVQAEPARQPVEEKIKVVMLVNGLKYEVAVKPGSSVYDLMNLLKTENKIDFSGKDYAGLGFFMEALNGLKNNPSGENWVYYINGKPAPVGISGYELKNNDLIEWRYEEKSF